ncbi:MAG TPA: hypothetical protein DET40_18760 [Lentisphaeria bacterium]|nr:MAG: hypothetical protein A2X45_25605 [Lentisphaerae bacterium GWF2_50_93]HCE45587.1 hypothetical protein [Lentisphaeria bacterium]
MGEQIKLFQRKDIVLAEDVLTVKGEDIPVKDISSLEVVDCGSGFAWWLTVILIGASGYFLLWFCSGNNSFIALDNMTGVFFLGIVVFSAIVVLRNLDSEKEGKMNIIVTVGKRRISVLKTKDMETVHAFEETLRKLMK